MPTRRPQPSEYDAFYGTYVDQVPDGPILERLEGEIARTAALLRTVSPERERHRYAPDRWSVREVVGHVIDSERVFGFRALHIGRGDPAALPGMDQEAWAGGAGYEARPLPGLVDELVAVRKGHVAMLRGMPEEAWERSGIASGVPFTVRALAWILAGHELHHRRVLEERYL